MWNVAKGFKRSSLLAVTAICSGVLLAGCDDYVQITRDPDVRIHKLATWAWRPAEPVQIRERDRNARPVTSRDVIGPERASVRDTSANNEAVRQRVKAAIEQTLASKGLNQISDPQAADFLVDYHFAVERRSATVPVSYPGVVCGPYGCWESWGWGPVGYEHIRFREGTIVFDFLQQSTRHLVYRAVGEHHVDYDRFSLTQDQINGLVHHLLKDLHTK